MNIDWSLVSTPETRFQEKKQTLIKEVNRLRYSMLDEGVTVNGITFQSRASDRENIAGALQLATLAESQGQPFSIDWIAMDNTVHTLDTAFIIALGQAVATRKAELIFRGRAVKDAILAAQSEAELPNPVQAMADP